MRDEYLRGDNFLSLDIFDRIFVRNFDFLTRGQRYDELIFEHAKKIDRKNSRHLQIQTHSNSDFVGEFLKCLLCESCNSRILRFCVTFLKVWGR